MFDIIPLLIFYFLYTLLPHTLLFINKKLPNFQSILIKNIPPTAITSIFKYLHLINTLQLVILEYMSQPAFKSF